MKIETTAMDDVWIGVMTVAVLYLVMRTISTLERISKKVDSMVEHIGGEVDSAVSRLSKEANAIMTNLEKNAFGCKENLFQHVQSVELQCYRSKNGLAFGLAPRTVKKHKSLQHQHQRSFLSTGNGQQLEAVSENQDSASASSKAQQQHNHQLVALHRCVDRILKCKYRWPFHGSNNGGNKHRCSKAAMTTQDVPVPVASH